MSRKHRQVIPFAMVTLLALVYCVQHKAPKPTDPQYEYIFELMNRNHNDVRIISCNPDVNDNASVYITSTDKDFSQLNLLHIGGTEEEWKGTVLIFRNNRGVQSMPDAVVEFKEFSVYGDRELCSRLVDE